MFITIYRKVGIVILLSLTSFLAVGQELQVSANVDKNPVLANESFILSISANDDLPRSALQIGSSLDTFRVGMTSMDTSTQIVNGDVSRNTRWQINLIARQPGTYEIPSFEIAGVKTQPIELEVIEPGNDSEQTQRAQFITAEIEPSNPYVQQQIFYRLKIHSRDPIMSGSVSAPQLANADVEQLGQDRETQEIINGQRYQVITRNYAITPRRSGTQLIEGAMFEGQVRSESPRSLTGFGRPQQVQLMAPDTEVKISPQPEEFQGHWLPSTQVSIEETWEPEQNRITLGEPVSRQITVTAEGVRPELLQVPPINYPATVRSYPDRGQTENFVASGRSISRLIHNTVIIPTETGELELPAISIPWWDTNASRVRHATLPARTIQIISPPGGVDSPRALDSESFDALTSEEPQGADVTPTSSQTSDKPSTISNSWFWLAIGFAVLWVITLTILIRKMVRKEETRQQKNGQSVPVESRQALQYLKQACGKNNPEQIKEALITWHRTRQGAAKTPPTLDALEKTIADEELSSLLNELQSTLYSADRDEWGKGSQLWSAISRIHKQDAHNKPNDLPPLYP